MECEPSEISSVVYVFHDATENKFLLERRAQSNPVCPNEVMFPSEKGIQERTENLISRGCREEFGKNVKLENYVSLQPFAGQVGNLGMGIINTIVISKWSGHIVNVEPEKALHIWVERKDVLKTLTKVESKLLFLLVLSYLRIISHADFCDAPEVAVQI